MPGSFNPIPEVQIGAVAYVWGVAGTAVTPISITGVVEFEVDSDEITSTWTEKKKKDTTGNTQNITQYEFMYERTLKIWPSGATRAAAQAVVGQIITLQNAVVAGYGISTFNGTWRIKPGTKITLKMEDDATIDIPMEKYVNTSQNTALTSAPITG